MIVKLSCLDNNKCLHNDDVTHNSGWDPVQNNSLDVYNVTLSIWNASSVIFTDIKALLSTYIIL